MYVLIEAHKIHHQYHLIKPHELQPFYEDKYQIAVEVSGELKIDKLQKSWSPEDK